jgi:hypothetical protein
MKKFYLMFFAALWCVTANSQFKFGSSYSLSIPQKEMADNIRPVHSLNISLLRALKGTCDRLAIGAEVGIGNYAYVTKEQDLRFPDGSGIKTDVIYSSNVFNAALLMRGNLVKTGKAIPYINAKAGISYFYSNVTVEDPEDPSSCKALERKNIIKDNTFFMAYGGGVQLDLSLFAEKAKPGKYVIDIGLNKIKGGSLNYVNTKNIQSHVHIDPNNPQPTTKGEPLTIQFINITTQTIHEHQVAELYSSPLHMIDIRVGMLFRL